jgi:hypothetical protein
MELMKITHHCHRLVKNDRFVLFSLVARPSLAHDAPLLSPIPSRSPHACGCCCWPPPPLLRFWCRGQRRGRRSWRRWPTLCCGRTSSVTACCPWGPWPREAARPSGAAGKQVACGAVPAASSSSAQFPLLPGDHACARRLRMPVVPGAFGLWLDGIGQT